MTKFFKLLGTFKGELVLEVIRQNPEHIFIMLLIPAQCISTFFFFLDKSFCLEHKSQCHQRPRLASGLRLCVTSY